RGQGGQALEVLVGGADDELQAAALHVAEVAQLLAHVGHDSARGDRGRGEVADAPHPRTRGGQGRSLGRGGPSSQEDEASDDAGHEGPTRPAGPGHWSPLLPCRRIAGTARRSTVTGAPWDERGSW